MRWLKDESFYIIVMLLLILIIAIRTPLDSDMWWHLRAGEETLLSGDVYKVDTLSYTREGENWINHSWLAQVVMIGLYKLGSYRALSLWVGTTAALSMLFVYLQMEGHPIRRMGIVLLSAFVSSVVWSPRPQIFSLLFFGLVGLILYRFKWNGKKQLYYLVPIFIIWSNLHAGYVLGIVLIGSYVAGEVINQILGLNPDDTLGWKEIKELAFWAIAGFALAAVNPNGIDMWRIPFQTVGVESLQQLIQEWASPDFHQPVQQLMLVLLFITFTAVGLSKRRLDGSNLVSFVVFGSLALVARRNFGPFAMISGPILARHFNDLFPEIQANLLNQWKLVKKLTVFQAKSEQEINPKLKKTINLIAILALVVVASYKLMYVANAEMIKETELKTFPVGAVNWLKEEHPSGNLFNSYNWGGYLTWNLREYQVFVDGRTDLFGDEIINQWINVVNAENDWQSILDNWDVEIIMLEKDQQINKVIVESDWIELYRDEISVIFTK